MKKSISRIEPYLYILPAFAIIFVFLLLPMFYALLLSLFRWDMISPRQFVGLRNYWIICQDTDFWLSLFNTVIFSLGSIIFGLGLSLIVAVLLSKKIRGLGLYRTAFFIPYVASMTAIAIVWRWILQPRGLLNIILKSLFSLFHLNLPEIRWLQEPGWARVAIIIFVVWKTMGFNILIFLTRLLDINPSYYEAADIDGANAFAKFRYITWPLLMPTTLFLLTISTIFSFQMFIPVFILTPDGGPLKSTTTSVFYLYQTAFSNNLFGYACAIAYILFFIILALTLLQKKVLGKKAAYEE
ncbi:MAG: sugar ABC transporter permease [Candidatus Euphemobacter frigidus]|nr:sugar ABC transporter permease [Candidatus Euphemobacter frigidus]MDP8275440.1 sugar ABC transporter permease [Candidatus Euphemobacter frigidus]